MKTSTILILVAVGLVVVGIIIGICAFIVAKFDISLFSLKKYEFTVVEFDEKITDINLATVESNITFVLTDSDKCKIECKEHVKTPHTFTLTDGVLSISVEDNRKWTDYISIFGNDSGDITVYLPEKELSNLDISSETGDISLPESLSFESIKINGRTGDVKILSDVSKDLSVDLSTGDVFVRGVNCLSAKITSSTGDIKLESVKSQSFIKAIATTGDISLTDVECDSLYAKRSTGETELKRVTASGDIEIIGTTDDATLDRVNAARLKIELSTGDAILADTLTSESIFVKCSTGDIELRRCDSASLNLETRTGDISGTFLSPKSFDASAKTGSVSYPKGSTGGPCVARTSTGSIEFSFVAFD